MKLTRSVVPMHNMSTNACELPMVTRLRVNDDITRARQTTIVLHAHPAVEHRCIGHDRDAAQQHSQLEAIVSQRAWPNQAELATAYLHHQLHISQAASTLRRQLLAYAYTL